MILIVFLLAPTVPSAPRPQNIARTPEVGSVSEIGIPVEAGVGDVVDDADGEVVLGPLLASSSKIPLTIAGVNSFEESP